MPAPLLETKLYVPRARPDLVPRRRLSELLDRGSSSTLTLVSAPAGFGKSTLLAQWLAATSDEGSAGWVSLDRADNDPVSFWTYVVAALRTVAPEVGAGAVTLLADSPPPSFESVLTTLLNDLGAVAKDIVLVLDDYHVIESRDIHDGVAFLLDHLPSRLHLVIASRADPPFPLARFRARGELVEVRAADLRFTAEEAAAYLNDRMGLALTVDDVAALEGRTEGWIAALQLAALSLQDRDDVAGFIDGFAGDDRYVVDYLAEEVVQRLSDPVQRFLLQTSILARLSGPLCDAVTGQSGGKATLEELDRRNLFLVPLDDRRRWYRYHHLFGDVLRARLLDELADQVPDLHRRASVWYEQNGELDVAIDHALAAGDAERAADLVEIAAPATQRERREATLRGWLERLPTDLFPDRPVLSVIYVGALMATGTTEGVEPLLRDAERWVAANTDVPVLPGRDADGVRRLPAWIAVYRAGLALATGDPDATVTYGQRALELLEDDDDMGHAAATTLLGLASWGHGDLAAAHTAYADGMVRMHRAGHVADVLGCAITLAEIELTQGRLREAMRTFEESLQLAAAQRGPVLRGTADMHVGISVIHRERGDLAAATQHLMRSQELGEHLWLPKNPHRSRIAMARILEAQGDLSGAVELLDEAERVYNGDFSPDVQPVAAMRARVRVRQGRLDEAVGWARHRGLSADDELSYLREFEHVTLARILLAQRSLDAAGLLERLLEAADDGGRAGSAIEILVLQALAQQQGGDADAALVPLGRALTMAEPEGYFRVFVDEGAPMARLLNATDAAEVAPAYVRRLLAAAEGTDQKASPTRRQDLVEPLSEREREVLRLLGTELSGPEIARELVVSLNTVRTHTKSIYAKLGVNTRRAAVRRAEELDLLSRRGHSGT
jgi:LuxR family transcriptional regulator, maltose regulon positive regulatory protein